jgi:AcrR family transcriptional regulator
MSREAILTAATDAIARCGVRGLRVEAVAQEAGVSAGLLYYHFDSRAGLIAATLDRAAMRAPSARIGESSAATGFDAVNEALTGELADDSEVRNHAVVWGEIGATAVFEPEVRAAVAAAWDGWVQAVADGLRAGIADASVDPDVDPDVAAETLVALVDGLCARWLAGAIDRERALILLESRITALRANSREPEAKQALSTER